MPRRAVIAVGVASHPVAAAGNTWAFLQWVLGFRELGWEIWMVEALDGAKCIGPDWQPRPFAESANRAHWEAVLERFGLAPCATLLVDGAAANLDDARAFANTADLFLNISGHFRGPALPTPRAVRVYLDLDPAFTQIWAAAYGSDMNFAGHHRHFTVGARFGREGCLAPACGIEWLPTLPPVVLSQWPRADLDAPPRFTTVAHWHGYSWVEWNGVWFKGKSDEFARFLDLPARLPGAVFEIATEIHTHAGELEAFGRAGWRLIDGQQVSSSFDAHAAYIRGSGAEFSAAKGGYVVSRGGWFSDRSVCYLASGRPVVLQSTGIEECVPTGRGLFTCSSLEEAEAACRRVLDDAPAQRAAARELAETHFASGKVIRAMVERL